MLNHIHKLLLAVTTVWFSKYFCAVAAWQNISALPAHRATDATVINHDELSLPKEWSENENEEGGRQTEDQFHDALLYIITPRQRKLNFSLIFKHIRNDSETRAS